MVVDAREITDFKRFQATRDHLNQQNKALQRPERYRIRYGKGVMRLESFVPATRGSRKPEEASDGDAPKEETPRSGE